MLPVEWFIVWIAHVLRQYMHNKMGRHLVEGPEETVGIQVAQIEMSNAVGQVQRRWLTHIDAQLWCEKLLFATSRSPSNRAQIVDRLVLRAAVSVSVPPSTKHGRYCPQTPLARPRRPEESVYK